MSCDVPMSNHCSGCLHNQEGPALCAGGHTEAAQAHLHGSMKLLEFHASYCSQKSRRSSGVVDAIGKPGRGSLSQSCNQSAWQWPRRNTQAMQRSRQMTGSAGPNCPHLPRELRRVTQRRLSGGLGRPDWRVWAWHFGAFAGSVSATLLGSGLPKPPLRRRWVTRLSSRTAISIWREPDSRCDGPPAGAAIRNSWRKHFISLPSSIKQVLDRVCRQDPAC